MWYGCSRTCSHSSGVSGPGFCQILGWTATRPRSWTRRRAPDRCGARRIDPATVRRRARQLGDAGRVPCKVGRGQVGEVTDRRQGAVDSLALQRQCGLRLARQRLLPSGRFVDVREDLLGTVGEAVGDLEGRMHAPARSRTIRTASSSPPSRRCKVASRATCVIRTGSGISSPLARRRYPLPSQRSVRWTNSSPTGFGSPSRSDSICATSQIAARWGSRCLAAFGSRRAIWIARKGAGLSGVGSARTIPDSCSRSEPNVTGASGSPSSRRRSPR